MPTTDPDYNARKQARYRARLRAAKAKRDKHIINARLGMLNTQQRALAVVVLSAVSDILAGTTNSAVPRP